MTNPNHPKLVLRKITACITDSFGYAPATTSLHLTKRGWLFAATFNNGYCWLALYPWNHSYLEPPHSFVPDNPTFWVRSLDPLASIPNTRLQHIINTLYKS